MVLYARSDMDGTSVPVDAGGCGQFHGRPVVNGAPVKLFAISCPGCERYLATDMLWTSHRWEIPLTPDEERQAEALEKQSERLLQQERNEAARARGRAVVAETSGVGDDEPVILVGPGAPDYERTAAPETGPGLEPTVSSEELARQDAEADLKKLTIAQLRIKARETGVSQAGAKRDLVARLKGSGA